MLILDVSRSSHPRARALRSSLSALVLSLAAGASVAEELRGESVELSVSPVQLDPADPERVALGELLWRGGLEFTSSHERVGGLSGLLVSPDGARLLAVSDKGSWLSARLVYGEDGRLIGIREARTARLRDLDGNAIAKKRWRDAESLARLEDGSALVGFEREHRIWRYAAADGNLDGTPTAFPGPEGLGEIEKNHGLEALVALPEGELLAFVERHPDGPDGVAYLWRDGRWSRFGIARDGGFVPGGATLLPGGDVLVLERENLDVEGLSVRLVRIEASQLRSESRLEGRELARWTKPLAVEKFEGIAARRGSGGETLVYLLADNDFRGHRPSVLLMFGLDDGSPAATRPP